MHRQENGGKNKEYDAFRSKTRKAKKMQTIPLWANEFFIKEAYQLAKIRSDATGIRWCVDHIVPLVSKFVCGLHCEQNIQLLPESINQSRVIDFGRICQMPKLGFYSIGESNVICDQCGRAFKSNQLKNAGTTHGLATCVGSRGILKTLFAELRTTKRQHWIGQERQCLSITQIFQAV